MTEQVRNAIRHAYRRDEQACLQELVSLAALSEEQQNKVQSAARGWIGTLRELDPATSDVSSLMQEYDLSNEEGVILMCLAEALLHIPDSG